MAKNPINILKVLNLIFFVYFEDKLFSVSCKTCNVFPDYLMSPVNTFPFRCSEKDFRLIGNIDYPFIFSCCKVV